MAIAVIGGTGQQGRGLAGRLLVVGEKVYIGSRSRERAEQTVSELLREFPGGFVCGGINAAAAAHADLVILTIPYCSQAEILAEIRPHVQGKIVVDTTVPLLPGRPPRVERIPEGSAAERAQWLLGPEVRVVGAFHTVSAHLLNQREKPMAVDTIVCGNDESAKQAVMALADRMGMRGIDGGPLSVAHTLERLTALLIGLNMRYRKRTIGIRFTNLQE